MPFQKGHKPSEKTKRKISASLKGRATWNKGKKMSIEARKKMSKAQKKRFQKEDTWNKGKKMWNIRKHPMLGKIHTKETRKKLSKSLKKIYKNVENHPRWKGGKIRSNGYIYVYTKNHPRKIKMGGNGAGYIPQQYLVVEKKLSRFLKPNELVHHLNGRRDDNRLINLLVFQGNGEHHQYEQKSYLVLYDYFQGNLSKLEVKKELEKAEKETNALKP